MFSFEVVQFNPTLKWIHDPGLNHISLKNPPLTVGPLLRRGTRVEIELLNEMVQHLLLSNLNYSNFSPQTSSTSRKVSDERSILTKKTKTKICFLAS